MMRLRIVSLFAGLATTLAGPFSSLAQDDGPDFKEVYDLVRDHLPGLSTGELNRAAVQGLVSALAPKVSLLTNGSSAGVSTEGRTLIKSNLFEGDIAYLRVGRVAEGLDDKVREGCEQLHTTNKLKGLVLDLRYAGGDDYAAAAAAAGLFLKNERPLLNWGTGLVHSKEKTDAISLPVAALVNGQTAGAAEALAAVLRETGAGLILGSQTAGQAAVTKDFPLKDGERLRIATAPVQMADGSSLSNHGLKPDIAVQVKPDEERAYYGDAYQELLASDQLASAGLSLTNRALGTNRPSRRRFNEAELVRERRDGVTLEDDDAGGGDHELEKPFVRDPALARALDLLKGLAVVRESREAPAR
jgi:hypothetical protein